MTTVKKCQDINILRGREGGGRGCLWRNSIGQFIGVGYLVRSWLLPWPVLGQWSCHVMSCVFVCLFLCCHLSSGAAKACLWTWRNPAGPHSCVFAFVCLLFVLLFGICCYLLSGVACLWTWRNPGPHSCVNQSESEATFSVEKSATASIIRHLPRSLEIFLASSYLWFTEI